jgi:hypothetical protein
VARAQMLLVPMDDGQRNHLKAYGLVYNALKDGQRAEWLLNYRGGSYFLPDLPELRRRAALAGRVGRADRRRRRRLAAARDRGGNMDAVPLEKAPKIAIYTPTTAQPWDDAVTLALTYADIPFEKIWDDDVLDGKLSTTSGCTSSTRTSPGSRTSSISAIATRPWFLEQRQRAMATARSTA